MAIKEYSTFPKLQDKLHHQMQLSVITEYTEQMDSCLSQNKYKRPRSIG